MVSIRLHCKLKVVVAHIHFHLGHTVVLLDVGELADAERYDKEWFSGNRLSQPVQLLQYLFVHCLSQFGSY